MTEKIVVSSISELEGFRSTIADNIEKNVACLRKLLDESNPSDVFSQMKFNKIAVEPISGKEENIIEVINQLQTYLISIMAAEYLLEKYPCKAFTINWGNVSGYDIESIDGEIIAECFAATSYRSNGKLNADLKRLHQNETASIKYEFFYDKDFSNNQKEYYEKKYSGIEIIKFSKYIK